MKGWGGLTNRKEWSAPKEWILRSHLLMYRRNLTKNVGFPPSSKRFQLHQYFDYWVVSLKRYFFPEILSKTSPTARPALECNDYIEKHERHFNPSEALLSICKLFTLQAFLIIKTCRQFCRLQIGFYTKNFAKGRWVGTRLDGVFYLFMESTSLLFYQKLNF